MTALSDRQAEFGGYFVAAGYPIVSAAAICGNATQENMCLPTTTGPKDAGSDGVLQWRLRRLANLQGLPNWGTLKTQAQFTILELQAGPGTKYFDFDYRMLEADLRAGTKPLATLTANFVDVYERPSVEGRVLDRRIKYASDSLAAIMAVHPLLKPIQPGAIYPIPQPIGVSTLDPMLVSVIEALVSGLVKAILQHVAEGQVTTITPTTHVTPVAPSASLDPAAVAKSLVTELGPLLQQLIPGVKL